MALAESWPSARLGSVVEISRDRVDPSQLGDDLLLHYSIPALDDTDEPISEPASAIGSQKFRVRSDAVLVSLLNPRIPRVWRALGGTATVCSTEFAVLTPRRDAQLALEFLHLLCRSTVFWEQLQLRAVGTTGSRQRAKADGLLSIEVMLPSLPEQRRIVDLVSALDAQIEALRAEWAAVVRTTTALRPALMTSDAVGAQVMTLGSVASWFSGSTPKAGTAAYYKDGTIPWAVIGDVRNGPIRSTATAVTEEGARLAGRRAPIGSVLVTMYGTIGRVGLAEVEMTTNQAIAWGVADPSTLTPEYLYHWLRGQGPALDALGRGATQRNINREIVREQEIVVLPLAAQPGITRLLDEADASAAWLGLEVSRLTDLRSALLDLLLLGQVAIPDSYDALLVGA